jgi:hypothetical protein
MAVRSYPGTYNIPVRNGVSFRFGFSYDAILDPTGYVCEMHVKDPSLATVWSLNAAITLVVSKPGINVVFTRDANLVSLPTTQRLTYEIRAFKPSDPTVVHGLLEGRLLVSDGVF